MASYTITYSCGHTVSKQLYGKESERQSYIAWAARGGNCADCTITNKQAACDAIEAEHSLPTLTGSDKQITWARTIRAEKIAAVTEFVQRKRPATMTDEQSAEFDRQYAAVMQALYGRGRASWWIDNRDRDAQSLAAAAYQETRQ